MKILYLSDDFSPDNLGGAGRVAFDLADRIRRRGNEVRVVTTVRNRKREGVFMEEGIKIYRIYADYHERWRAWLSLYNPQTVGKVKKIIKDFKPGVVHTHNIHYYLSYHCLKLAKKGGARVFLTAHDVMSFTYGKLRIERYLKTATEGKPDYRVSWWDNLKIAKKRFNPLRNFFIRHYFGCVDRIFAVSEALRDALRQNGITRVEVVRNGIEADDWKAEDGEIKKFCKEGGLTGKKVVLFGGRLSIAKGMEQAREVIDIVKREIPEAILVVFGGKSGEEITRKDGVVYLGWLDRDKMKLAYGAANIVLVPSVCFDSFPTVILEAMAGARPVVATIFGGSRELVEDGKTGYIVNPFNIEAMSNKIANLLIDERKAEEFGKRGYERVKNYFSLSKQAEKILKFYEKKIN